MISLMTTLTGKTYCDGKKISESVIFETCLLCAVLMDEDPGRRPPASHDPTLRPSNVLEMDRVRSNVVQ